VIENYSILLEISNNRGRKARARRRAPVVNVVYLASGRLLGQQPTTNNQQPTTNNQIIKFDDSSICDRRLFHISTNIEQSGQKKWRAPVGARQG